MGKLRRGVRRWGLLGAAVVAGAGTVATVTGPAVSASGGTIQNSELGAAPGTAGDGFGAAVAETTSTSLIGAPDRAGLTGAAYVFSLAGGHWQQTSILTAADGAAGDAFGSSVAVMAGTAVVGAPGADSGTGAAYVFTKSAGHWSQVAELTAADGAAGDRFGSSVSVSTSGVLVGAPGHDGGVGTAYLFSPGTWAPETELADPGGSPGDGFGTAVSIATLVLAVGAPGTQAGTGAVYVDRYSRRSSAWQQQAALVPADATTGDGFGAAVDLSGPEALIAGAPSHAGTGAAYVYDAAPDWTQAAELTATGGAAGDEFGSSVSLSGATAAVGAPAAASNAGAAYVFADSGSWSQQAQLTAWDTVTADDYGVGVATMGASTVVGAPGHDQAAGAADVFSRRGTTWGRTPPAGAPVYRWGAYLGGEWGSRTDTPTVVPGLSNVVAINAGNSSGYALECAGGPSACASDGTVWAWGDNDQGQLGDGTTATSSTAVQVQIPLPPDVGVVSIGEARNEGFAIDATGQAYAWGFDGEGSMCLPHGSTVPAAIPGLTDVVAVQGAGDYSLWLMADRTVKACGQNSNGELGDGGTRNSATPVAVEGLSNIVAVSAGGRAAGALDASGQVWMWGDNREGELGVGSDVVQSAVPLEVTLPAPATVLSVGGDVAGDGHSLALLQDGTVWGWGDDVADQVGDHLGGTDVYTPASVYLPPGVTITTVAAGGDYSLALDSTGAVWAWGAGDTGQIGQGVFVNAPWPVKVDTGVTAISTTANNSVDFHG